MYTLSKFSKLVTNSAYRRRILERRRLATLPRYCRTTTVMLGDPIEIVDPMSFQFMFKEIFEHEIFRFTTHVHEPFIIDAGANIGLATIYFKRMYPRSRVVAFEPDPVVFQVLSNNISRLGLKDVQLVNHALWSRAATMQFWSEGSYAGRIISKGDAPNCEVSAVPLGNYLSKPIDFLKIDIEGAEVEVLQECADKLHLVERMFLEYHSFPNEPQRVDVLFDILAKVGFRVQIHQEAAAPQPFFERKGSNGFEFQMKVFAFRD